MKPAILTTALVAGLTVLAMSQQTGGTQESRSETVWEASIRGVSG